MARLIIAVRHGQSAQNHSVERVLSGDYTSYDEKVCAALDSTHPLTSLGEVQAERAAAAVCGVVVRHRGSINRIALFTSPYARARATATPFESMLRQRAVVRPCLREREWGELQTVAHHQKHGNVFSVFRQPEMSTIAPPGGGESSLDLVVRVRTWARAAVKSPADVVIAICHGDTMWALRKIFESQPLTSPMLPVEGKLRIDNGEAIAWNMEFQSEPRLIAI